MSDLKAKFDELLAEKAALRARTGPLREKREALLAQIVPYEQEAARLAKQIKEIEQPRMNELDMAISFLAKLMGGKRLSEGR